MKVYRVAIRRGKEVLVDLGRLTFRAPRWGYENWAPIFQHLKFFLDDYLLFRRQKDGGLLELEDRK